MKMTFKVTNTSCKSIMLMDTILIGDCYIVIFYSFQQINFVFLGGKPLVHSLQVQYIHQLIQSRLVENPQPLTEVYNCLHFFCQSLQLEVLYSQTLRLMRDRLDDHIHVDEYIPGKGLTVSYWR